MEIYNSLSRKKESFKPIVANQISMYVCGPTVYDYCHIGHARLYIVMDVVVRYFRYLGYNLKYIRNITDIDDKIIQRANENKEPYNSLSERFIQAMHEDLEKLHLIKPDLEPKATEYLAEMIDLIQDLIKKGFAYVADNGDVYYDVRKFKGYGELSNRDLDDLKAGTRVEVNEAKQNPLDFVLWKSAKPNEPKWPSPFGEGRPGWHTECSAMSLKNLGETIDIHGGGADLKFPHHENERAQSEVRTGKHFVNTWMHVGFLQINKEKMSKSLGNFLTIRDCLKEYHPEVLRYFNITSHYRSPVEYSDENLHNAALSLERMYTALRGLNPKIEDESSISENTSKLDAFKSAGAISKDPQISDFQTKFNEAMNDDFNTPVALSVLFDMVREINREREQNLEKANILAGYLKQMAYVLGILNYSPEEFLQGKKDEALDKDKIKLLIEQREQARQNKNWAQSDKIRAELTQMGIVLEDTPQGTLWRKEVI